jgi:hypothetical protein
MLKRRSENDTDPDAAMPVRRLVPADYFDMIS